MKEIGLKALGLAVVVGAVGCANPSIFTPPAPGTAPSSKVEKEVEQFRPNSTAGVEVKQPAPNPILWAELVHKPAFSARPDPFALQSKERAFEVQQTTERVFGDTGFRVDFIPPTETIITPEVEPQPYRRLAGVIVGDSVLALIDMGDGQLQLIRPGSDINGWHVDLIDSEKAVLSRRGNKLPHEITVRLEEPPPGGGAGFQGGINQGRGNPGGGFNPGPGGRDSGD